MVDSGGLGVVILLEGLAAGLAGRDVPPAPRAAAPRVEALDHAALALPLLHELPVEGAEIDGDALEAALLRRATACW